MNETEFMEPSCLIVSTASCVPPGTSGFDYSEPKTDGVVPNEVLVVSHPVFWTACEHIYAARGRCASVRT